MKGLLHRTGPSSTAPFAGALALLMIWSTGAVLAETPEVTYEKVVALGTDLILGDEQKKIAAAEGLEAIRAVYSVPVLEKALEDPSVEVKLAVVGALGAIAHKSSVKALYAASFDEERDVALAAIVALGDMHTQDAYDTLMKLLGKVKDGKLRAAVLDGIKKWNKPFTPLPEPVSLPEGMQPPPVPSLEPPPEPEPPAEPAAPDKPAKPGKKGKTKEPDKKEEPGPEPDKPAASDIAIEKVEPTAKVPPVIGKVEVKPIGAKPLTVEPDVDAAFTVLESASDDVRECTEEHEVEPPFVPVKVTITAGGGVSQVAVLRTLEPMARGCVVEAVSSLEFPPASTAYALEYEYQFDPDLNPPQPLPGGQPAPGPSPSLLEAPPASMLEMWDLNRASGVTLEVATAKLGAMPGRITTMKLHGGWTGKWVGLGAVIPFSGGTALPAGATEDRDESWLMNNLGLWVRHAGEKDLGKIGLRWGVSLTIHLPTSQNVPFNVFELPSSFTTAAAALYAGYSEPGSVYPNLEKTFKTAVSPSAGLAMDLGPLSLQVQTGFDFVVLGDSYDPEEDRNRDVTDVSFMHLDLGAALRPLPWLQLSLELNSVFLLGGRPLATHQYTRDIVGVPVSHEAFVTPGVAVLVPVGQAGAAHLSLGLRLPLGQIGGYNGPSASTMQLEPILVMSAGFRWMLRDQRQP